MVVISWCDTRRKLSISTAGSMHLLIILLVMVVGGVLSEGWTECRPDGLNIRCKKRGYEADTLTVNNKLHCSDGSTCHPVYYNIAVYYNRCGRPSKNVKNYTNRYLRPYEAYSYHFAKADPAKCFEYVIHTCSRTSRPINCSQAFDITTY